MEILINVVRIISLFLILIGVFFFFAATVGILRMPDQYTRGHTGGKADSPGFLFSMVGIWLYWVTINFNQSLKILLIVVFMLIVNPIVIHSILRYCFRTNQRPMEGTKYISEEKNK